MPLFSPHANFGHCSDVLMRRLFAFFCLRTSMKRKRWVFTVLLRHVEPRLLLEDRDRVDSLRVRVRCVRDLRGRVDLGVHARVTPVLMLRQVLRASSAAASTPAVLMSPHFGHFLAHVRRREVVMVRRVRLTVNPVRSIVAALKMIHRGT